MKTSIGKIFEAVARAINPGTFALVLILGFSLTLTEEHRFAMVDKIVDLFLGHTVLYCIIIATAIIIWYLATKSRMEIRRLEVENDRLVDENKKIKEILLASRKKEED